MKNKRSWFYGVTCFAILLSALVFGGNEVRHSQSLAAYPPTVGGP